MDYSGILKRTWDITWKYKGLWVLGIIASCSAAGRGSTGNKGGSPTYQFPGSGTGDIGGIEEFGRVFETVDIAFWLAIVFAILCLILILSIVFLLLGIIGQGGLISGFSRADQGYEVTLSEAFRLGVKYLWKLLAIRILFWFAGFLLAITLFALVILSFGVFVLCLCLLVIPLIVLGIMVDAYVILTMVAAVEEELDVLEAFKHSWQVLRDNFWPVVLMALILIVGSWIASIIIALPILIVFFPALIGVALGVASGLDTALAAGLAISGLCMLAALPILILVNAIITTFTTGGWTITYRRLIGREGDLELGSTTPT